MSTDFESMLKKALLQSADKKHVKVKGKCLTEEDVAGIIDGKIQESKNLQHIEHISSCQQCASVIKENFLLARAIEGNAMIELPHYIAQKAMDLFIPERSQNILDIILNLKQKVIELVQTTGDILIGQELVPVAVLRGKHESDKFQNEIKVVKTFDNILAEVGIEKRNPTLCDIEIRMTEKDTKKKAQDLRVTLTKKNREIESTLVREGKVVFREVSANKYRIVIAKEDKKIGVVELLINSMP